MQPLSLGPRDPLHPAVGSEVCAAPSPVAQPFIHWVGVDLV